jgi:hypothetical protein
MMATKRHNRQCVVAKLRRVDILTGKSVAEAVRSIARAEITYFRGRAEYGGMKSD